jgi:hypothetical protein
MRTATQDFLRNEKDVLAPNYVSDSKLPLALKLVLLALFLPPELSFYVADLRMTLERLAFLILTPIVFVRLFQKMAGRRYRFVASDLFVPLAGLWMFIGPSVTYTFDFALKHSGPVALEYVIAYMSTRVLLSGHKQSLIFINWICVLISFVVLEALIESFMGQYVMREVFGQITGFTTLRYNEDSYRFGLLRASGPIDHPILFGFACGIGLLLAAATKIRWRGFCIAACAVGAVFCFSSAPQQSVLMGFVLLLYSRVFEHVPRKWLPIWITSVSAATIFFLITPNPFGHIFDLMTINSSTAYFRLFIWYSVGPAILQNPFFAILEGDYDYEGSVDSIWLVLSLSYGMVCSILTALSMVGACSLSTISSRAHLSVAEARIGTALGIVIFLIMFMGFTVHFWGAVWILVGLLVGLRAHLGELGRV